MNLRMAIILSSILPIGNIGCSTHSGDKPQPIHSPASVQLDRFSSDQYRNRQDGRGFSLKSSNHVYFVTDWLEEKAWAVIQGKKIELRLAKELSTQPPEYTTVEKGAKYKSVFRANDLVAQAEYTLINRFDADDFVRLEYRLDLTLTSGTSTQKYVLYNTSGG